MRLEFFDDAAAEVEEDRAWYLARSESAEAGFLRELDHAIQQVSMPRRSGRGISPAHDDTCSRRIHTRWCTS